MRVVSYSDISEMFTENNSFHAERFWNFGKIFSIAKSRSAIWGWNMGEFLDLILESVDRRHFVSIYDDFGRHVALGIWSCLDRSQMNELISSGPKGLVYLSRSGDGSPWVWDLSAKFGMLNHLLREMVSSSLTSLPVTYFRVKSDEIVIKRLDLSCRRSKFSNGKVSLPKNFRLEQGLLDGLMAERDEMVHLGETIYLLSRCLEFFSMPLSSDTKFIEVPRRLQQSSLLRNGSGEPVAYVSWAWRQEFSSAIDAAGWRSYHWNNGGALCLVDTFAISGYELLLKDFIIYNLFPDLSMAIGSDENEEILPKDRAAIVNEMNFQINSIYAVDS